MLDIWAIARLDLGLSEDEVGELSLYSFSLLVERKMACDNRIRLNAGIIAASIYNAAPFKGDNFKAVSPLEFVPDWKSKAGPPDLSQMEPEEVKRYLVNELGKTEHRRKS